MSAVLLLVLIILAIVLVVPSVSFRSTDRHTLAGHRRRVDALARLTGGPPPEAPNPTADPTGHVRVVDGDVAPSLPVSARRAHVAVDPWQPTVASRHVPPPLPVADIDLRPRPVEELPPPQIPTRPVDAPTGWSVAYWEESQPRQPTAQRSRPAAPLHVDAVTVRPAADAPAPRVTAADPSKAGAVARGRAVRPDESVTLLPAVPAAPMGQAGESVTLLPADPTAPTGRADGPAPAVPAVSAVPALPAAPTDQAGESVTLIPATAAGRTNKPVAAVSAAAGVRADGPVTAVPAVPEAPAGRPDGPVVAIALGGVGQHSAKRHRKTSRRTRSLGPPGPPSTMSRRAASGPGRPAAHPAGTRRRVMFVAAGCAAAVLLAVIVSGALSRRPAARHLATPPARPATAPTVTPPTTTAPPVAPAQLVSSSRIQANYRLPSSEADIEVVVTSPSWVQIRVGSAAGPIVYQAILHPGDRRPVPATGPVWVRIGNPPGISIVVDGTPLPLAVPDTSAPYNLLFQPAA